MRFLCILLLLTITWDLSQSVNVVCNYKDTKCEASEIILNHSDNLEIAGSTETKNRVQEFILSSSQINHISSVLTREFPKLNRIVLYDNQLGSDIFRDGFDKIEFLIVSKHNWNELRPNSLKSMRNLMELSVIDGDLTTLDPRAFENNRKIKSILMFNNKLREIPTTLFEYLLELEVVNFGDNELEAFDENSFKNNRNLQRVFFYGNRLTNLPLNLFNHNPNLLEMNFGDNRLSNIDQNMLGNNQKLVKLLFYGNSLSTLEINLFINLRNLEEVNFGDNSFSELKPDLFQYNMKLITLNFYGNQFEKLEPEYFRGISNLLEINFGDNYITKLDADLFKYNKKIRKLLFYGNRIQRLNSNLFKNLYDLQEINFGDNQLEFLSSIFKNNRKLVTINLYGNSIRGIRNGAFDRLPKLNRVSLLLNSCSNREFEKDLSGMSSALKECYENCESNPECDDMADTPNEVETQDCGIRRIATSFAVNGTKFKRGKWPWIAALYYKDTYSCVGNLITKSHIVTTAHCFQDKGELFPKNKRDIYFLLGRNDLGEIEEQSLKVEISKYNMHHDWDPTPHSSYEGDIAVATLKSPVEFSVYIQPICLNNDEKVLNWFDKNGTVAGWGKTESGLKTEAREVTIPVVSTVKCLISTPAFANILSINNFCAGNRDGTGPCEGDSGGGMFVEKNRRWILLGLVSSSLISQDTCDLDNYVIFTDALSYYHWILSNI